LEQAGADEAVESHFQGRALQVRARPCLILATVFFLAVACGTESVYVLGAGLANFIYTDQVPTDFVAEYASGKQCSLLKAIEDGGPLCRDSYQRKIIEKPIYCYRTIGVPTCYATPDPYGTGAQQIR